MANKLSPIPTVNTTPFQQPESAANNPTTSILSQQASGTTVTGASATPSAPFGLTTGWFVFFGVGAGVLLSGTQVAPILLGVLTSALLYQLSQLIEGK